jgi:hypothetical protein
MIEIDPELVAAASEVLKQGSRKVYKTTRAGFTTSAVLAAMESNKRILVVSPTNKILSETVMKASGGMAIAVPANSLCQMSQEQVRQDPFLSKIPLPLPDCQECTWMGTCPVTAILKADDPPVISLTYAKINAVMLSKSEIARQIRKKLSRVDTVLLDEAHTISLPSAARVQAFYSITVPEEYPVLTETSQGWIDLCNDNLELLDALKTEGDAGHVGKHLSENISILEPLGFKRLSVAWTELLALAKRRAELDMRDDEILALRDIISIMGGYWASVSYIREREGTEGLMYISGNVGAFYRCLGEFLSMRVPYADHIYSSATLVEPYPKFFDDLSGKFVQEAVFPDLRHTNSKMSIYPDRWRLSFRNFNRNLDRIVARIVEIYREEDSVYILAPNLRKAAVIHRKLLDVLGPEAPKVDFYRSDTTMGVARSERTCIAVGLAEIPSNACDHLARGNDPESRWLHSQVLRVQSVQAASWQAWSRVKDPSGEDESRVYCIGIRADQASEVVTWGAGRRLELTDVKESKTPDGTFKTPIFKVEVDTPISPPKLFMEERRHNHRDRQNVRDYIDRVEFDVVNFIISEKLHKMPILNHRQNVHIFGIYNNPIDENEINITSKALYDLFVTRTDCYTEQWKVPDGNGRYGYSKLPYDWNGNLEIIKGHISGNSTIGIYQISLEDQVRWICFDLDNHDGKNPNVREDVKRLLDVLGKYSIPCLLEASGSPDSFHVWVLIVPAKTLTAYFFSRQIIAEVGVKCEIFPKQKGLGKDGKYGNQVKLPLGINRKNGVRSQFLDPETFLPYANEVPVPGLIRLREVQEPKKKQMSRAIWKSSCNALRPCIKSLIESRVALEGSEGHTMRVAIAVEACNMGMNVEEAVDLFQCQSDFDREFTHGKVEEIYSRGYNRFSCEKLRDQCGSLVVDYCATCPYASGVSKGHIEGISGSS